MKEMKKMIKDQIVLGGMKLCQVRNVEWARWGGGSNNLRIKKKKKREGRESLWSKRANEKSLSTNFIIIRYIDFFCVDDNIGMLKAFVRND